MKYFHILYDHDLNQRKIPFLNSPSFRLTSENKTDFIFKISINPDFIFIAKSRKLRYG